jgi:hypothetical protein
MNTEDQAFIDAEVDQVARKRKMPNVCERWHIIETDNFCRDYPDEIFIARDIKVRSQAEVMANALNARFSGDGAPRFFRVVEDGYKLEPGFQP